MKFTILSFNIEKKFFIIQIGSTRIYLFLIIVNNNNLMIKKIILVNLTEIYRYMDIHPKFLSKTNGLNYKTCLLHISK